MAITQGSGGDSRLPETLVQGQSYQPPMSVSNGLLGVCVWRVLGLLWRGLWTLRWCRVDGGLGSGCNVNRGNDRWCGLVPGCHSAGRRNSLRHGLVAIGRESWFLLVRHRSLSLSQSSFLNSSIVAMLSARMSTPSESTLGRSKPPSADISQASCKYSCFGAGVLDAKDSASNRPAIF